jgi:hypothetical protein
MCGSLIYSERVHKAESHFRFRVHSVQANNGPQEFSCVKGVAADRCQSVTGHPHDCHQSVSMQAMNVEGQVRLLQHAIQDARTMSSGRVPEPLKARSW